MGVGVLTLRGSTLITLSGSTTIFFFILQRYKICLTLSKLVVYLFLMFEKTKRKLNYENNILDFESKDNPIIY